MEQFPQAVLRAWIAPRAAVPARLVQPDCPKVVQLAALTVTLDGSAARSVASLGQAFCVGGVAGGVAGGVGAVIGVMLAEGRRTFTKSGLIT